MKRRLAQLKRINLADLFGPMDRSERYTAFLELIRLIREARRDGFDGGDWETYLREWRRHGLNSEGQRNGIGPRLTIPKQTAVR
jgi:hypothetical protein